MEGEPRLRGPWRVEEEKDGQFFSGACGGLERWKKSEAMLFCAPVERLFSSQYFRAKQSKNLLKHKKIAAKRRNFFRPPERSIGYYWILAMRGGVPKEPGLCGPEGARNK